MVYGIIELINFAHGDVFMLGAVHLADAGSTLLGVTTATHRLAAAGAAAAGVRRSPCWPAALLNVTIERVAYRPLRHAPRLAPLITAIGVSFMLENTGAASGRAPVPIAYPDSSPRSTSCATGSASTPLILITTRTCMVVVITHAA